MQCYNCGREMPGGAMLCMGCGSSAVESSVPLPLPTLLEMVNVEPPRPADPPYAGFVVQIFALGLCLATLAFSATDNLAHGYWHVPIAAMVAFVGAIPLMFLLPRSLRTIETIPDAAVRPEKLFRLCLIFVALFIGTGAVVGAAIGSSGKQTAQVVADFHEFSRLSSVISATRKEGNHSVPGQIAMYKAMEPDVIDFDELLHRLQKELPVYDEKFPLQHARTAQFSRQLDDTLKEVAILRRQITVAHDIEFLDPPARYKAWLDRMEPLLVAESQLGKTTD